jgi:hypothetical protein
MMQGPHWMADLRRPRFVWLAVLLALFSALAPTLSHALAATGARQAFSIEVCTGDGLRRVVAGHDADASIAAGLAGSAQAISTAGDDGSPASTTSLLHCPFCLLGANTMALPPAPSTFRFVPTNLPVGSPRPNCAAPRATLFVLVAAPRGPPSFS